MIEEGSLLYVCGPMSGFPKFNVPAFLEARDGLLARGYKVQLPADLDDPVVVEKLLSSPDGLNSGSGLSWGDCLALDVKLVADIIDGIAVLPGWQNSQGAQLETFVARRPRVDKPVVHYPSLNPVRKKALFKAWTGTYFE